MIRWRLAALFAENLCFSVVFALSSRGYAAGGKSGGIASQYQLAVPGEAKLHRK